MQAEGALTQEGQETGGGGGKGGGVEMTGAIHNVLALLSSNHKHLIGKQAYRQNLGSLTQEGKEKGERRRGGGEMICA